MGHGGSQDHAAAGVVELDGASSVDEFAGVEVAVGTAHDSDAVPEGKARGSAARPAFCYEEAARRLEWGIDQGSRDDGIDSVAPFGVDGEVEAGGGAQSAARQ